MGKFFSLDSPLMRFLNRMADLIWLNILTAICCIPIFTIGAALTSMHYVLLKLVRDEEGYLTKSYFHSFKQNFKQATGIWMMFFVALLVFIGDLYILSHNEFPKALSIVIYAIIAFVAVVFVMVFPVLSRFDNSVKNTIRNSLLMGIANLPKTLAMLVLYIIPWVLGYFFYQVIPFVIMFGISLPAYISAKMYSGVFKKYEPETESEEKPFDIDLSNEDSETQDHAENNR